MSRRIGLVIGQLGWGGAERQLARLAAGLDPGEELAGIFCLSQELEPFGNELLRQGLPLFHLQRRGHREPGRVLRLAGLMRRERIGLVHSFLETANLYTYLARPLAGRPMYLPSVRSLPAGRDSLRHSLNRLSLKSARLIVANSRAAASAYAARYRVPPERFRVVANGMDLPPPVSGEDRAEARRSLSLNTGSTVLGTVSRDEPDKNVEAFIRLAERISREAGPICAVAAGRGLDEAYAARLKEHPRRNVCQALFLGPLNEMPRLYRALDLFVLTSLRESLPNSLLEAMAHGVPCVAYAAGGVPEVLEDGISGRLVESGDEEGLFRAALAVLSDPEQAHRLGEAGRRRVEEHFSVESMVRATRGVYQELENILG